MLQNKHQSEKLLLTTKRICKKHQNPFSPLFPILGLKICCLLVWPFCSAVGQDSSMKCSVIPSLFLVPLILKMWIHDAEPRFACQIRAFAGSPNSAPLSSVSGSHLVRYQFRLCNISSNAPYLRSASSSWWIFFFFLCMCIHIKHESSRSAFIVLFFFTPWLPFCHGWEPLSGRSFCLCRCSRVVQ